MGGGAGIQFTIRPESFCAYWNGGRKLTVPKAKLPKLESFSAEGYMDGMNNVRGDLLKVVAVSLPELEKEDIDWLKEDGMTRGEEFWIGWGNYDTLPKECVFGGYVRGDWRNIFPLEITGNVYIQRIGNTEVTFTLAAGPEFEEWYRDVFEIYSTGLDEERKRLSQEVAECGAKLKALQEELDEIGTDEDWWDMHRDGLRVNYGAGK